MFMIQIGLGDFNEIETSINALNRGFIKLLEAAEPNRNNHKSLRTFGAIMLKGVMPLCVIWWAFSPMFTNATGSDIIAEEAIAETPADSVVVVTETNSTPQVEAPAPKAVDRPATTPQEAAPSDTKPEQADIARQPATDVVHVESLDEISAEITPETTVEIPADAPVIE